MRKRKERGIYMARRRRPAAETRADILKSAERRLREAGPGALRLDEIAADVGISRQAVLHHFGSREGVLRAVVEQAWGGLFKDLAGLADSDLDPTGFVELVDDVARRRGNARLGAWLLLSGQGLPESWFQGAASQLPGRLKGDADARDTAYSTLLVGAALFGDAIFGVRLRQVLGLPDSEEDRSDFRRWLAERVLQRGPKEDPTGAPAND
jgi:AcrR family transcriptional regulator